MDAQKPAHPSPAVTLRFTPCKCVWFDLQQRLQNLPCHEFVGTRSAGKRSVGAAEGMSIMFDADGRFRERCSYYRMMARDALRRAALTKNSDQRVQLFNVALGWHALAVQIEESLGVLERGEETVA
jgi:hypothetical protein